MDSRNYWRRRQLEREQHWYDITTQKLNDEVKLYYQQSLDKIQRDIAALYARFGTENKLSPAEARRLIRGDEFKVWRMTLEEYVKAAKGDSAILKELNTLAMRSRISRFEALHARTLMELADLCEKLNQFEDAFQYRAYIANYYGNLYDIHRQYGLSTPPVAVDKNQAEKVIRNTWSGANYSTRIWKNGAKLEGAIKDTMLTAIHRGTSIQKLSTDLSRRMEVGYNDAERLIRTELNYIQTRAAADSIVSAEMGYYQFIAVMDNRTTPMCQSLDGEIFPIVELNQGENAPPMHVRCRSTIAASEDDGKQGRKPVGQRAARDEGGKRIKVPADMTYRDWKAVYIDKTRTLDDWRKAKDAEYAALKPKDFKTEIKQLQQTYANQKASGASQAELEKTLKSAGRLVTDEMKKVEFAKLYDWTKLNDEILMWKDNFAKVQQLLNNGIITQKEMDNEYNVWQAQVSEFKKIYFGNQNIQFTRAKQVKDILSQVREMGATSRQFQLHFGKSKSKIRPTVESAMDCYPRTWVESSANRGMLKIKKVSRGYYNDTTSELCISGEGGQAFSTAIHEFGHRMEHTLSEILSAEAEFYGRRTQNESLVKLNQLFPKGNYRNDEVVRKDKFLKAYMGKDYKGRAYELVSMGFEKAFTDPEFLLKDTDMAEWIFGLLALV